MCDNIAGINDKMANDGKFLVSSMIPLVLTTFLCTALAGFNENIDVAKFLNSTLEKHCPNISVRYESVVENTLTGNQYPCCKPCSVHKECGRYRNCCAYGADIYRYAESGSEACILSSFGSSTSGGKYYYMVSKCLDPNQNCQHAKTASWGSLYPVYSHNSKRIYMNKHCSICNGEMEVTSFQPIFGCSSQRIMTTGSHTEELANLLAGKNSTECELIFEPPEGTDLTNYKCSNAIIRTCPEEYANSELMQEMVTNVFCETFNATFLVDKETEKTIYGNVFCALCNGETNISDTCSVLGARDSRDSFGMNFHSILTGLKQNNGGAPTYGVSTGKQICRTNNTFYNDTMCKPLLCPEGRLWDGDTCRIFIDYRGVRSYFITVKLTNANSDQQLPASLLESLEQEGRGPRALWLKRAGLQDWDAHVFYKTLNESVDTVEYIIVMLSLDLQEATNMAFVNVLDVISVSMAIKWELRLFDQRFYFQVKFDKYTQYYKVPEATLNYTATFKLLFSRSDVEIEFVKQLSRINSIFSSLNFYGIFITETFFCNQIDLLPVEYTEHGSMIYLHHKNEFLGNSQFKTITNDDSTISMRVCQHSWADNSYAVSTTSRILWFRTLSIFAVAASYLNPHN